MHTKTPKDTPPRVRMGIVASLVAATISILMIMTLVYHVVYEEVPTVITTRSSVHMPIRIDNDEVAVRASTFFTNHSAIPAAFGESTIRGVEVRCGHRPTVLTDTLLTELGVPQCVAKVIVAEKFTVEQPLCVSEESGTIRYERMKRGMCIYHEMAEVQYVHIAQPGVTILKTVWLTFTQQAYGWTHDPPMLPQQNKSWWRGALIEYLT